jgi:hypothetical protein
MCDINERAKETNKINWDNEAAKFKEYKIDSHAVIMGIREVGFYIPQQVFYSCGIGCGKDLVRVEK